MLFYITKITAIARFAISNVEIRSPRYLFAGSLGTSTPKTRDAATD